MHVVSEGNFEQKRKWSTPVMQHQAKAKSNNSGALCVMENKSTTPPMDKQGRGIRCGERDTRVNYHPFS